jgi:peptidoglycan-N-acetylglucosamine deacetylase
MGYPGLITNVETAASVAALTFDDGPHPVYTPRVLSILEKHGAKATFFMIGEAARKYPEIVRMVAKAGHIIGNHAWNHTNLTTISSRLHRLKQMWACARATAPYCKRLFRPPHGGINDQIRIDSLFFRYKVILWCASAQDWIPQQSGEIAQKIIERVRPGSIFLLHDAIYSSHLTETLWDRQPMLDGLEKALASLKQEIHFVTIPELLKAGRPASNWPHSSK